MSTTRHLAVDIGASGGKSLLGEWDGSKLTVREVHRFANRSDLIEGHLRWDIDHLDSEVARCQDLAGPVDSLGIDTWGVDFCLLDSSERLLGRPAHYRDHRTDGLLAQVESLLGAETIYRTTGIQAMGINTLVQLFALARQEPETLAKARTFLTIPDYLHWKRTGVAVCEFTNATTTQCFDPTRWAWATNLLEPIGVDPAIFPPVVPPGTEISAGVVLPASHDTGSAVASLGLRRGDYWLSSGTWSIVGVNVPAPVLTDDARRLNLTNEGGLGGTFRLGKNVMGLWVIQEWLRHRPEPLDSLLARIAAEPPFPGVIDIDHPSLLAPDDMPGALRSLSPGLKDDALLRAVLESLALKYRWVVSALERASGVPCRRLRVMGGGSQNDLLNQLTADCLGVPVVAGPVEATALGNLVVQIGRDDPDAQVAVRQAVTRISGLREFTPRPDPRWESVASQLPS